MKAFAQLIRTLDATNSTNARVEALAQYFTEVPERERLFTIALLSHRRPKRPVTTTLLREWAAEAAGIPLWLFEETYHIVGDLSETIALLLPNGDAEELPSLAEVVTEMKALGESHGAGPAYRSGRAPRQREESHGAGPVYRSGRGPRQREDERKTFILESWAQQNVSERFVFNKLLTGGFRIGISQKLMTRALSKATGIEEGLLAHRLMGDWDPFSTTYRKLVLEESDGEELSRPYPFLLAYPLEETDQAQLDPASLLAEHKWDGIRAQLILRKGERFLWSRGEELITDRFPELETLSEHLDNCVLDGEILPWIDDFPGDFQQLQKRIGKKKPSAKLLRDIPIRFIAYDLLEADGNDLRPQPLKIRRHHLENLLKDLPDHLPIRISEAVILDSFDALAREREKARDVGSEGLMLKDLNSEYGIGRKKGLWYKWKLEPRTIDAVLTYAMRGHGRRTNLYTDYTFALWDQGELVTVTKAYSGLTDAEFREVDAFVRKHTLERFGPVRRVEAHLVFEIAFEGLAESNRHKSGVALRFPRMLRWRKDKKPEDANTLDDLKALLNTPNPS